jgi:putative IMPACT (imprinted ancient) family translation regulator
MVVVVRYFGGTLLGVPGLINAYKTATTLALQTTPIIQKQIEVNYLLHFDYTRMNDVMMIVKQYNCTVVKQEQNLFCDVEISIPKNRLEEVLFKLGEMHTVETRKK